MEGTSLLMSSYPSIIGLSGHGVAKLGRGRCGNTPSIHRLRTARPDLGFMFRFIEYVINIARIFRNISEWVLEITEDIIPRAVTSRAPCRVDPMLPQI